MSLRTIRIREGVATFVIGRGMTLMRKARRERCPSGNATKNHHNRILGPLRRRALGTRPVITRIAYVEAIVDPDG